MGVHGSEMGVYEPEMGSMGQKWEFMSPHFTLSSVIFICIKLLQFSHESISMKTCLFHRVSTGFIDAHSL